MGHILTTENSLSEKSDVPVSCGNGAVWSCHSVRAGGHARPHVRQAEQREHLGRERKGPGLRGRREQGLGRLCC